MVDIYYKIFATNAWSLVLDGNAINNYLDKLKQKKMCDINPDEILQSFHIRIVSTVMSRTLMTRMHEDTRSDYFILIVDFFFLIDSLIWEKSLTPVFLPCMSHDVLQNSNVDVYIPLFIYKGYIDDKNDLQSCILC